MQSRTAQCALNYRDGRWQETRLSSSFVRIATEELDYERDRESPYGVSTITFSTAVNVGPGGIKNWIKAKLLSLKQRLRKDVILDNVFLQVQKRHAEKLEQEKKKPDPDFLSGWTESKVPNRGKYKSLKMERSVSEPSFHIYIGGVDTEILDALAQEIRKAFHQESVHVDNRNTGTSYLIRGRKPKEADIPVNPPKEAPSPFYQSDEVRKILH